MEKVSKESRPSPQSEWSSFEAWGTKSWFPCTTEEVLNVGSNKSESKSFASANGIGGQDKLD